MPVEIPRFRSGVGSAPLFRDGNVFKDTALASHSGEYGVVDSVVHLLLLREFDLRFCGVDIDIDRAAVQGQIQDAGGKTAGQESVFIGLLNCCLQELGLYVPAVAVEILPASVAPAIARGGDKAVDGDPVRSAAAFKQGVVVIPAEDIVYAGAYVPVSGGEEFLDAVFYEAHLYIGPSEGAPHARGDAGLRLGSVGFEEFEPGRGVVEEVRDGYGRPLGTARKLHVRDLSALELDETALRRTSEAGGQNYSRDGGYGRQSLAAKAHRRDALQPFGGGKLRCGVAGKGKARVVRRHSAAVVDHPYEGRAAVFYLHGDRAGAGVDGVFHELLDDGGRAFDYLARGDHIGKLRGQYIDYRHRRSLKK